MSRYGCHRIACSVLCVLLIGACTGKDIYRHANGYPDDRQCGDAVGEYVRYRRSIETQLEYLELPMEKHFLAAFCILYSPEEKYRVKARDALSLIYHAVSRGSNQAAEVLSDSYLWGRNSLFKNNALAACWRDVQLQRTLPAECVAQEDRLNVWGSEGRPSLRNDGAMH